MSPRSPAGRRAARDQSTWDPYAGALDHALVEAADVVVNLAGSPTLGNPHSEKWARELRESRVTTTRVLAEAIAASERRPAFLAGNGISFYGDRDELGDPVLDESADSRGDALLTSVAREWQAAAEPAAEAGARLCVLRTAPVMDRRSAPLKQLRLLFLAGFGGKLGTAASTWRCSPCATGWARPSTWPSTRPHRGRSTCAARRHRPTPRSPRRSPTSCDGRALPPCRGSP